MKKLLLLLATVMLTSMASMAASYTRVSDTSTLKAGDKIILLGDYAQSGSSNPYWLVAMNLTDVSKTNVPGQVLGQSTTAATVGDTYEFPADKTPTDITLVESGNEDYPWLLQVTVNGDDYYLCCTSTASKSQMTFKKVSDKTNACMAKLDGTFQFNTTVNRRSLEFNISNGKNGTTTFNCYNVNGQKQPAIFKLANEGLGEIVVKDEFGNQYGTEGISINEGVKLIFSAENADNIQVDANCGDWINGTVVSGPSPVEWSWNFPEPANPDEVVESMIFGTLTVTATMGTESVSEDFNITIIRTPKPEIKLGELIISGANHNNIKDGDVITDVPAGSVFSIQAENAESITVNGESLGASSAGTWIAPSDPGTYEVYVVATKGADSKTIRFTITIPEEVEPTLGEIVVTYGDGLTVENGTYEGISVEAGTTFSIYAENATHITAIRWSDSETSPIIPIIDVDADNATWTFSDPIETEGLTITATRGEQKPQEFEFLLTVTEPVIANNEFVKVTSLDQLNGANSYIIVGSSKSVYYGAGKNSNGIEDAAGNNRQAYEVTVADNKATVDLDKVDVFTLVKNGENWYIKTSTGHYLNNSDVVNKNKLLTTDKPQSVSISLTTQNNAIIQFLDGAETSRAYLRFNAANSAGPIFGCYVESGQNAISLYCQENEMPPVEPEIPTFDQIEADATKVSFKSTKGELHVWTAEYDSKGKLVKENGEDVPASIAARVPADDDFTWTNKVADEGVVYEIAAPTTEGNYLKIRAKAVIDNKHSDEIVKNIDANGDVVSGVESVIVDDENAPVEYFNLQGIRVNADQPGIYIRRQGSKVEKVSIAR